MARIFVSELVAHVTVAELHAVVRFYGSPERQHELTAAGDDEIRGSVPPG